LRCFRFVEAFTNSLNVQQKSKTISKMKSTTTIFILIESILIILFSIVYVHLPQSNKGLLVLIYRQDGNNNNNHPRWISDLENQLRDIKSYRIVYYNKQSNTSITELELIQRYNNDTSFNYILFLMEQDMEHIQLNTTLLNRVIHSSYKEKKWIIGARINSQQNVLHMGVRFYLEKQSDIVQKKNVAKPYLIHSGQSKNYQSLNFEFQSIHATVKHGMLISRELFENMKGFSSLESFSTHGTEALDICLRSRIRYNISIQYSPAVTILMKSELNENEQINKLLDMKRSDSETLINLSNEFTSLELIYNEYRVKNLSLIFSSPMSLPNGFANEAISYLPDLERWTCLRIRDYAETSSSINRIGLPRSMTEMMFRLRNKTILRRSKVVYLELWTPSYILDPVEVHAGQIQYRIGRFMFETDRIPKQWLEDLKRVDEIWVPSEFNRESFIYSGVPEHKLQVIPETLDLDQFDPNLSHEQLLLDVDLQGRFKFLSVFEWSHRKGWDLLVRAYFSLFTKEDPVVLILKTRTLTAVSESSEIEKIRAAIHHMIRLEFPNLSPDNYPLIQFITRSMSQSELPGMYQSLCDAFVLVSRGEGWCRPCMEAMAMEKPVIITNWGGSTEFMNHDNSLPINYTLSWVTHKDAPERYFGHKWAEVDLKHLQQMMKQVSDISNKESNNRLGKVARKSLIEKFSPATVVGLMIKRLQIIEKQLEKASDIP
jgi:glycosyltransferase involved in cell wall biosynthesis